MATKPTKKNTKKAVKAVKRHKKFDLSVDRPEQAADIIDALQSLQSDRGWLLLKQIFEGNIATLEAAILRKVDPEDGKTALKEEECDRLRDRLAYLEELLNKPNEIIGRFNQKDTEVPEYDPYAKVRRVGQKE